MADPCRDPRAQRPGVGFTPGAEPSPEPSPPGGSGDTNRARPPTRTGKAVGGRVPVLTQALLRAWGLDDPRVVSPLRHENQAGRGLRTKAIGDRARDAGWPLETATLHEARIAQRRALQRLERMDYTPQGQRDRYLKRTAAAAPPRRPRVELPVDDLGTDDGRVSIYDE